MNFCRQNIKEGAPLSPVEHSEIMACLGQESTPARAFTSLTAFCSLADDDAFEPAEANLPTPRGGGVEGSLPRHVGQPPPSAETSSADLEDSTDSSSALLVPPDPAQSGSTPATEAPPGGGHLPRGSLNTVV